LIRPARRARIHGEMSAPGLAVSCLAVGRRAGDLWELLVYSATIVVVLLLLAAGILWVRRNALGRNSPAGARREMEQIEMLHRQGQLTEGEYKAARRSALGLPDRPPESEETAASPPATPAGPDEDTQT